MVQKIDATSWVYMLVQKHDTGDHIVGQVDSENGISFIPIFMDKESANHGVIHIPKEKGKKYEIQAIIFEDLENYAAERRFILFIIDSEGNVIDKRAPFQST